MIRWAGGIRTLQDLIGRCVVEEDTGCWVWKGAVSPRGANPPMPTCHFPAGVLGGVSRTIMSAGRAAWLLDGRQVPDGHVVYRRFCTNSQCVAPAHSACDTRKNALQWVASTGRNRGNMRRRLANVRNGLKAARSAEDVARMVEMLRAGSTIKAVCDALRCDAEVVRKARDGRHINSPGLSAKVPGASVFSWRPE